MPNQNALRWLREKERQLQITMKRRRSNGKRTFYPYVAAFRELMRLENEAWKSRC